MFEDGILYRDVVVQLRRNPETLAVRASREHYLYLADVIEMLKGALDASVNLQSHYAHLLNMHDGGNRLQFTDGDEWIRRLVALRCEK